MQGLLFLPRAADAGVGPSSCRSHSKGCGGCLGQALCFPNDGGWSASFPALLCHPYVLGEIAVEALDPFLNVFAVLLLLRFESSLSSPTQAFHQLYDLQRFSPSLRLVPLSSECLSKNTGFKFDKVQFMHILSYGSCVRCPIRGIFTYPEFTQDFIFVKTFDKSFDLCKHLEDVFSCKFYRVR